MRTIVLIAMVALLMTTVLTPLAAADMTSGEAAPGTCYDVRPGDVPPVSIHPCPPSPGP